MESSSSHVIEIHTARLRAGVDPEAFRLTNQRLMPELLRVPGLLRRELAHDPESGLWTDIIHWKSREARGSAMAYFAAHPHLHGFANDLDHSTMKTVTVGDVVDIGLAAAKR